MELKRPVVAPAFLVFETKVRFRKSTFVANFKGTNSISHTHEIPKPSFRGGNLA